MAEIAYKQVFKKEILSVSDFAANYGSDIKPQSVYYAMDNALVDYVQLGNRRYIVMTATTKQYKPNENKKRPVKKKGKKR